ncbi:MAG TPA: hypothetical protein VIK56_09885 [Rhodoferax sp.]
MVMTIEPNGKGGLRVRQTLVHPLVYLDHWAVRRFADQEPVGSRFIAALHVAGGTWVFSQANLSEFIAMRDAMTARRVEALIAKAFPHFYVLDTVDETDCFHQRNPGGPRHPDAPDRHWILVDLGERAMIAGGRFNTHRFISDAITHADMLLPIFEQMKRDVARAVAVIRDKVLTNQHRRKFVPQPGMSLKEIFRDELLLEPEAREGQRFTENDATDLVHALPACLLCDMVLLDSAWCHKVGVATKRIRKAGIKGNLARCFSPRQVAEFLGELEAMSRRQ